MNKKAVLIGSGGIDSTTLLYKLINEGYKPVVLTFLYGQKHNKEIEYVNNTCRVLNVKNITVDISGIKDLLQGSALTDSKINIPDVPETTEHFDTLKTTIVPNRNSVFLTLAVAYAQSTGCNHIFFGAHFSDRGVYPDCRKEFVQSFENSQILANDNKDLRVSAPFVDMDKADIVKLGEKLGVPFKKTWSCYKGEQKHCGVCSSCRERKRAFIEANVTDPTVYQNQ
ncbi:MAG: 7-cyano-7-deazaguanine synthase QueC [Candidatus Dadabacteria bacterium]|nr:7-cyano-7-deazaguanine synthase QueC [Candidatus Dadabacteria bacterium]NIS09496.1 7-cyano-7-deazaguanine synthase QueC [Candidatus Dadabacteria bacterium]NIV41093.1 7-cyano-7-deazaguanine synthase QueC [Candidatus Dadabacteria bacterium]NIY21586.1 7-cyano-7-deazaguanine synthase QueC [Candidatus Dadabacteria bacterium]